MNTPTKRTGPSVNRHRSKADYRTPRDFLEAIERRFGPIELDLAASAQNAVSEAFVDEKMNALALDWSALEGTAYCNPPFDPLEPWVAKLESARNRLGWTLLLCPASVGSNWFAEHVEGKVVTLALSPRIKFVGETKGYPKDLALLCAGFGMFGFATWRWGVKPRRGAKP